LLLPSGTSEPVSSEAFGSRRATASSEALKQNDTSFLIQHVGAAKQGGGKEENVKLTDNHRNSSSISISQNVAN